jgi:hypothetical protein
MPASPILVLDQRRARAVRLGRRRRRTRPTTNRKTLAPALGLALLASGAMWIGFGTILAFILA